MNDGISGVPEGKTPAPLSGELVHTPFEYAGRPVRTATIDGEPWFVAADVCAILGYANGPHAVRTHVPAGRVRSSRIATPGAVAFQDMTVISEPGLYRLIMRSNATNAAAFQDWVTAEVLPTIRRTGTYGQPAVPDITQPGGILAMAEMFADTARQLVAAEARNAELVPKAEAYDEFMSGEGVYLVGTVAKMLGLGQNTLFARLHAEHILIKGGKRHNTPYQQYMKHFRVVARDYNDGETVWVSHTTYVKPSGVDWLRKVLKLQDQLVLTT